MGLTTRKPIPRQINRGLSPAGQTTMLSILGNPRRGYDNECRAVEEAGLKVLITTADVGPFRTTGLKPAIASLKAIFKEVATDHPDVHGALGTAGMQCARFVRGSKTSISNHSWGTAIDLTLNGVLDMRGDDRVQEGLIRIAPIFHRHRWYWGAGFTTEDAMHFECSDELIRDWRAAGELGPTRPLADKVLSLGDRGPAVRDLQERLNAKGGHVVVNGDFGRATHAAVMTFQAKAGLAIDGVVGPVTAAALAAT